MFSGIPVTSSADGWRGIIDETFTPGYAGFVTGCVLRAMPSASRVLVTYDGRRAGGRCADAVVAAASAAGAGEVHLVPHLPTPVASAVLGRGLADIAFLVTASHNPARYNGIKVKVAPGRSLSADVEKRAEACLAEGPGPADPGAPRARIAADHQARTRWVTEHVTGIVGRIVRTADRRSVVVDGVGGIAGDAVARLCEGLGWSVHLLGSPPDPGFGGLVPDPTVPATRRRAVEAVQARQADLGIVLDGDGDRIVVIDDRGRTVQPHELLALLLQARWSAGGDRRTGGLAVTVATGVAPRTVATRQGRTVLETPIGFKYLTPLLVSGQADAAGGSVGDLAFADHGVDRDPCVAVALLAELLGRTGASLGELLNRLHTEVGTFHWFESRVPGPETAEACYAVGATALAAIGRAASIRDVTRVDGVKFWLDRDQWVLLRGSSTEGGVRIYGEFADGDHSTAVPALLDSVRRSLANRLS